MQSLVLLPVISEPQKAEVLLVPTTSLANPCANLNPICKLWCWISKALFDHFCLCLSALISVVVKLLTSKNSLFKSTGPYLLMIFLPGYIVGARFFSIFMDNSKPSSSSSQGFPTLHLSCWKKISQMLFTSNARATRRSCFSLLGHE